MVREAVHRVICLSTRHREGLTFDPVRMRIYTAMSQIRNGMEDNKAKGKNSTDFDIGGPNDIRVAYNPCGACYNVAKTPCNPVTHRLRVLH